jgi:hypothetical protein
MHTKRFLTISNVIERYIPFAFFKLLILLGFIIYARQGNSDRSPARRAFAGFAKRFSTNLSTDPVGNRKMPVKSCD